MATWKLEDAKNRFSELVRRAMKHEPQLVTRHGRKAVVVLSAEDYEGLTGAPKLRDFLRDSPFADALAAGDLDLRRSPDRDRDISF